MAFKVIRLGNEGQQAPLAAQPQQPQQEQPSNESNIFGRLGIKAAEGIESPFHLLNALTQLVGGPNLKTGSLPSEDIASALGYNAQQQEPRGLLERFGGRVLQQAPFAAALGAPALARTALSNIPAALAGHAGAPEIVQDLTQIGSDIGANVLSGKLGSKLGKYAKYNPYQGDIQTVNQAQKAGYEGAQAAVPSGSRQTATRIAEGLTESKNRLGTEVNKAISGKVNHLIDKVKENFHGMFERPGEYTTAIDPKKALELRKSTYALNNTVARKHPQIREYTKPITEGINKFFVEYGAENPEFYKHLNKADRLTEAKHVHSYLADLVERLPIGKGILSSSIKGAAKEIVGSTIGQVDKFAQRFVTNKPFRELVASNIKAATSNNIPAFQKGLAELGKETQESAPKHRSKPKTKGSFKVVRYGKE